jgi:PEP-CTERM motif
VTNGTFSFNYSGNYGYGYYNNYRDNSLNSGSVNINEVAAVPEPGTLGLMGTGLLGLALVVKRKIAAGLISAA